jgi:dsDNA-specific endonuclease/ATPase MutS2
MADAIDTKGAEAQTQAADAPAKVYDESHVKGLIAERDEAKRRLREIDDTQKKAEADRLAAQGEYKTLLEKSKAEVESLKAQAEKAAAYEKSFDAMLKKEAEGIEDIADAIISNTTLSHDERIAKVRALKEKLGKTGGGTSPGGSQKGTDKKTYTAQEASKLSPIERARLARIEVGG